MPSPRDSRPAIEGGTPVRTTFLPFFRPSIDQSDVDEVAETLRSGWLTLGPQTRLFEERIAEYLEIDHVVAVNSCSAGMFLALDAMGVGPGDEVITSALTFASTVHAIVHTGATPVLADIETETFGPAPEDMLAKTTDRTKAYLPVHFGGQACRIREIVDMAAARGIRVVEDAAHSFGAEVDKRRVGGLGDVTAFSFYATKNVTSGEGGCLSTKDRGLADCFRTMSYHGMSYDAWRRHSEQGSWYYDVERLGYKFNMSDLLSALGLSQLARVDKLLDRRRRVAERFLERLRDSVYFELPRVAAGNLHTWHLFVVQLNLDRLSIGRDQFVRALSAENIGCSVHFIPVYRHQFYQFADRIAEYPNCESYFSRCLSLPIFPDMSDKDVDDVVEAMNRIAGYYSRT